MADRRLEPDREDDEAYPHGGNDPSEWPGRGSTRGTPRWVRLAGVVLVIGVLALVIVLHLTGTLGPGAHR